MARRPVYMETMQSLPEPATLLEIQQQASMLFGAGAYLQAVRSSVERLVALGKLTKMEDADGAVRYWITGKPVDVRSHLKHRISKLKAELRDLERQLIHLDKDNPSTLPASDLDRLSKMFQKDA